MEGCEDDFEVDGCCEGGLKVDGCEGDLEVDSFEGGLEVDNDGSFRRYFLLVQHFP